MKQVIFDTDIGIDDAMALLFLHFSPHIELRAIVTGFGNASVADTTRNALFIKEKFGIPAPVYRGAGEPIGNRLGDGFPDFVHGRHGLGDIEIGDPGIQPEAISGAEAIVAMAQKHPGEMSVVAVGRLTNLALALDICPELPVLLREVVIMGGAFGFNGHRGNVSPVAEANIAGDPQAADRVLTSGLGITMVGLDVTQETIAGRDFFADLRAKSGDAGELIYRMTRFYLDFHKTTTGRHECPVHDSSAVAFLLNPHLYRTQAAVVRVVTDGIAMGQTIHSPPDATYASEEWDDKPVIRICTSVDADEVLGLYLRTLAVAGNQL